MNVNSSFNFVAPIVNRFNTRSTDYPKEKLLENSIKFAEDYFKCSHNNGTDFIRLCFAIKDGENISYDTSKFTIYVGRESIDFYNSELINSLNRYKEDILELSKNESILFPKNFTRGFMQLLAFGAIKYVRETNQLSYQGLSIDTILQVIVDAFLEYKGKIIQHSMCQGENIINDCPGYYIHLARFSYDKEIKEIFSSTYLNDIDPLYNNEENSLTLKFAKKHYDNCTVRIFLPQNRSSYLKALNLINNISETQLDGNIKDILTQIFESLSFNRAYIKEFSILFAISILGKYAFNNNLINKKTVCSFIQGDFNLKISENDIPEIKINLSECTDSILKVQICNIDNKWLGLKNIADKHNILQTTSL